MLAEHVPASETRASTIPGAERERESFPFFSFIKRKCVAGRTLHLKKKKKKKQSPAEELSYWRKVL